jgi:hypothetical protein
MFDNHFLLALAPVTAQRFSQTRECAHELRAPIYVYFYTEIYLVRERSALQTLHGHRVGRYHLYEEGIGPEADYYIAAWIEARTLSEQPKALAFVLANDENVYLNGERVDIIVDLAA